MAAIGIQSAAEEVEFFPVLRSGHGKARPDRSGFDRALGEARADSLEEQLADEALDDELWKKIKLAFGIRADEKAVIPQGYSIVVELPDGKLSVFRGEECLQEVLSFADGVVAASDHDDSPSPTFN